jgi:nitrous oxidase accessory protein NosD
MKESFKCGGLFFLATIFSLFIFSQRAQARSYDLFVDASNTGTEDGSEANPYNTISEALNQAVVDNKISVKEGTYIEDIVIPREVDVYGEKEKGVIINGGTSGTTVTMNHKTKLKNVTVDGGEMGIKVLEEAGVDIDNVTVKNAGKYGILLEGNHKTRDYDERYERLIEDCKIEDNNKGIYIRRSNAVIIDSEVKDNDEEGIDMRKGVKAKIKDNEIEDNGENNIEFKVDDVKLKIKDNDLKDSDGSGISAQSYQKEKGRVLIEDNKIKDNDNYGLRCSVQKHNPVGGWASIFTFIENIFSGNDKGDFSSRCGF